MEPQSNDSSSRLLLPASTILEDSPGEPSHSHRHVNIFRRLWAILKSLFRLPSSLAEPRESDDGSAPHRQAQRPRIRRLREPVTGFCTTLKALVQPRVLSTIKLKGGFPNSLPNRRSDFWPASLHDWNLPEVRPLISQSEVVSVSLPLLASMSNLFLDQTVGLLTIPCCFELPEGESKIVVFRRELGIGFSKVFLFSELIFLHLSRKKYSPGPHDNHRQSYQEDRDEQTSRATPLNGNPADHSRTSPRHSDLGLRRNQEAGVQLSPDSEEHAFTGLTDVHALQDEITPVNKPDERVTYVPLPDTCGGNSVQIMRGVPSSAAGQHAVIDQPSEPQDNERLLSAPPRPVRDQNAGNVAARVGEKGKRHPKDVHTYVEYLLCCESFNNSIVLDMVLTVSRDVGEQNNDIDIVLTCPASAGPFLKDVFGLIPLPQEKGKEDLLFGRQQVKSVQEDHRDYRHGFIRFITKKELLKLFAGAIEKLQGVYGTGIRDLFDLSKPASQTSRTLTSTQSRTASTPQNATVLPVCAPLRDLEYEVVKMERQLKNSSLRLERTFYAGSGSALNTHVRVVLGVGEERVKLWSIESRKSVLNGAAKSVGISSSLEIRDVDVDHRSKPPMFVFLRGRTYKLLWHTPRKYRDGFGRGVTVIKKMYETKLTGTGVKVDRLSVFMWLAILVGVCIVVTYVAVRASQDAVGFEDLIQTALAIAALYLGTIIPIVYYWFYKDENISDVVRGKVHLDTRGEFDSLKEEEKLVLCLRSQRRPESDRTFIDRHNTCYVKGSVAGAAMRVNIMPCIANLLSSGFKYWKDAEGGNRRGLISPSRSFFELKDTDRGRGMEPFSNILHAEEVEADDNMVQTDCRIQHFYVGFGP